MPNLDPLLAGRREFRPVLRNRRIEIEFATLSEHQCRHRSHRFCGREVVDDAVGLPRARTRLVDEAAPDGDDGFAADEDSGRRADVLSDPEMGRELIADTLEPRITNTLDDDVVYGCRNGRLLHDDLLLMPSLRATGV